MSVSATTAVLPDADWRAIGPAEREDHALVGPDDRCYFWAEYLGGHGYRGGAVNQLILDLKCRPSAARALPRRACYKRRAMQVAAAALRETLAWPVPWPRAEAMTWVPVPPSQGPRHPDYDDRLLRTVCLAFAGLSLDVRPLVRQSHSLPPGRAPRGRCDSATLSSVLQIDEAALAAGPVHGTVALFDDVLTTGRHFQCCARLLRERLPGVAVVGVFLARRVFRHSRPGAL